MGGDRGPSETQQKLQAELDKQDALKKQQNAETQKKQIQGMRRKRNSFAGDAPTSLISGNNQTLG